MPKAPKRPLSALFALNKPSGVPSMTLLNQLQPLFAGSELFKDPNAGKDDGGKGGGKGGGGRKRRWKEERVKLGQGGTLDPLADGVLVVGSNAATKHLSRFLDCTKEYRAIGLLGSSTDSYDSEGKRVRSAPWEGITREMVESKLDGFRGEIEQTPPIYSALKMDGKPLYEYARTSTPLPRPIPTRKVTVSHLSLLAFTPGSEHAYDAPTEELDEAAKRELGRLERMVKEGGTIVPSEEEVEKVEEKEEKPAEEAHANSSSSSARPPTFEIHLTVSSGTYIRSIVHDLGLALGSAAHVVKLQRVRQGEFILPRGEGGVEEGGDGAGEGERVEAVEWGVFERALGRLPKKPKVERQQKGKGKKGGKGAQEKEAAPEVPPPAEGEGGVKEAEMKAVEEEKPVEEEERDADGWAEWEREILRKCKEV
ncbi:hypothetical protein JCM8097_000503 [Rhodosporidiobolus ruineniae]